MPEMEIPDRGIYILYQSQINGAHGCIPRTNQIGLLEKQVPEAKQTLKERGDIFVDTATLSEAVEWMESDEV